MPLESTDPGYKNWLLAKRGYDTNAYEMDDNGNISSKDANVQPFKPITQEPVPTATPISTKPQTSSLGALGGHAMNSFLPTMGGLGGAALGALAAPETGGLSLAIPLLAGLSSGAGVSALQSSMEDGSTKQALAQEQTEHPIASKIGDLAPSALAFNPVAGLKGLVSSGVEGDTGVIQSLGKLLGPTGQGALTSTERAVLANTGINAGIQGGINAGQQLVGGQPFNYKDLAADTASGAIMNQPWGLGKMLFPQHNVGSPLPESVQRTDTPITTKPPESNILGLSGRYSPENTPIISTRKNDAMFNYKENEPVDVGTFANEGGPPLNEEDTGEKVQQPVQQIPQAKKEDIVPAQESEEDLQKQLEDEQSKFQPLQNDEKDFGLFKQSDPQYVSSVAGLAKKRGISLLQANDIISDKGNVARGSMNQGERVAKYDPNIATEDTIPHEVGGHGFIDDLASSKFPVDQKLAARAKEIFGGDEPLAEKFGQQSVGDIKQDAYGTKAEQKKLWWRDLVSRYKDILGVSNDQDVMNHLSRRFRDDAPRGSRGEVEGGAINTAVKSQEEPNTSQPEDKGQAARLNELNNKGESLTPEEITERDALQSKSDSLKGKWKFQEDSYGSKEDKPIGFSEATSLANAARRNGRYKTAIKVDNKIHTSNELHTDQQSGRYGFIDHNDLIRALQEKEGKILKSSEINRGFVNDQGEFKNLMEVARDSMADNKYQEGPLGRSKKDKLNTKGEETSLPFSSLPGFRSVADVIQAKDGPKSLPALDAAGRYLNEKDAKSNEWIGQKNEITKGLSNEEKNLIEEKGIQGVQEGRDTTGELPAKLQEPFGKLKELFGKQQDEAIAANQPVDRNGVMSPRKKDPNFWPQNLDPNSITMMKGNSVEGRNLRDIWDKYNQSNGMSKKQSKARIDNILILQNSSKPDLSHFRGLDVAQGIGLPKELQRPGFDRNFERYANRFAAGRSFHDNIESRPDIAPLFNIKNNPYGKPFENPAEPLRSPEVANLLSSLRGNDFNPHEGVIKGLESVATAGMLGPPTSLHIAASSIVTALNDAMPGEQAKLLAAGFKDINGSLKRTYSTGLNRYKPKLLRDFLDSHSTTAEKLNSLRDLISTINGREGMSKYTNAVIQNMGEYLVGSRIPLADMGNKQAIRFMQNLDPLWKQGKTYSDSDKLNLAANYAQQVHGAHDFRSMPQWMMTDNIIHPFVSLMSWNIAQTNRFFKSTITPAIKEGNYAPLITATLGAGIGGYILKEAREAINNKKSPIPSLIELANSSKGLEGNLPLVGYNFAAMASYAGYAGILSTIARDAMDVAYKNPAQGSVFPLDEVLSNSAKTISQSVSAIANSQPSEYFDIGTKAVGDLLRENIQIARMAASWGDQSGVFGKQREDKKNLNTAEGDLRRYKMAEGMPVDDEGSIDASNPYLNMSRKNFQKEQDIGKAAGEVPDLINEAFKQSGGNMEVLRSKLRALKDESYPSMPSPEHTPMTFWRYVEYLKKTQGDNVASKRVQDYFMHNAINKAKSSMVPSF